MIRVGRALIAVGLCAAPAGCATELPFSTLAHPTQDAEPVKTETPQEQNELKRMEPGYFNGIGSYKRTWGAELDSSFDTNRVATARLELSRAFRVTPPVSIVARVNTALAAAVEVGDYLILGPNVSLGLKNQSRTGKSWLEFGLRLVPGWEGPQDNKPSSQVVALGATYSSGLADDARWLPFAETGLQLYGIIQNRTATFGPPGTKLYVGALYGGQASLWPMKVRTWLGPQTGFIGNAYADVFLGLWRLSGVDLNLQVGGHGEVSLSTIWPADHPFPMLGGGFVAWSPEYWVQGRIFAGAAGSPSYTKTDIQYGFRLEFFVP